MLECGVKKMKIRKDFVTNSSSSSYVCEICGRTESGWDATSRECGMIQCVNGHVFCEEHTLPAPSKEVMLKMIMEQGWNEECWDSDIKMYRNYSLEELSEWDDDSLVENFLRDGGDYEVAECLCPICQFEEYSESDLSRYLFKLYGVPRDEVFAEVKKLNKRRKKLYDSEYITYVCKKFDLNVAEITAEWPKKFNSYAEFNKYLRS